LRPEICRNRVADKARNNKIIWLRLSDPWMLEQGCCWSRDAVQSHVGHVKCEDQEFSPPGELSFELGDVMLITIIRMKTHFCVST